MLASIMLAPVYLGAPPQAKVVTKLLSPEAPQAPEEMINACKLKRPCVEGSLAAALLNVRVISVKSDDERRAAFSTEAEREGLNFTFFDAIIPDSQPPYDEMIKAAEPYPFKSLKPLQFATAASHRAMHLETVQTNSPAMMVFEDDALLTPGFVAKVKAIQAPAFDTFDILKLEHCGNRQQLAGPDEIPTVIESFPHWACGACYVITQRGAKLLSEANTPLWANSDGIMDPRHLNDVGLNIVALAAIPKLAKQPWQ